MMNLHCRHLHAQLMQSKVSGGWVTMVTKCTLRPWPPTPTYLQPPAASVLSFHNVTAATKIKVLLQALVLCLWFEICTIDYLDLFGSHVFFKLSWDGIGRLEM